MFQEHTVKRFSAATAGNLNPLICTPIIPAAISSVSLSSFIGWACLGIGITGIAVVGGLALFQRCERRRITKYRTSSDVIIDVESTTI